MRTVIRLAVLALALAVAPAARAEFKLGFVEVQRALQESDEGKAAISALKKDFEEKQKVLKGKGEELQRLGEDLQRQASLLTPEARMAKGAELDKKGAEYQQLGAKLQQELNGKEREVLGPVHDKMMALIREVAQSEGFTFVVDREAAGLVYAPESFNITNELVRKYNARYPAGKPAAKPAAAPAAPKADAPAPAKK